MDALKDVGVDQRLVVDACPRCGVVLEGELGRANYCPRCGATLIAARVEEALVAHGLDADQVHELLVRIGLPTRPQDP